MKKISFIIPCYKSESTVSNVLDDIISVVSSLDYDYEIITVNDNSPDNLMVVLESYAKQNTKVKVISFTKNFGQHAAFMAGINYSSGDYLVFLDDDGQCPIDRLQDLLKPLNEDWDVSIARYGKKAQTCLRNLFSKINEFTSEFFMGKPKDIQMGNFSAMKRIVADTIKQYSGPYPSLSGLLFRATSKITNVPMKERPRIAGKSNYNFSKLFFYWVSRITAFSIKPLRLATILGGITSVIGIIYGIYIVIHGLLNINAPRAMGWNSIMATLLFLGGMILFVLGIMGEYVGRIYMSITSTPQYVVHDTINFDYE